MKAAGCLYPHVTSTSWEGHSSSLHRFAHWGGAGLDSEAQQKQLKWTLTSRHQVLPKHRHPEVASQRGQVGPYAGELLANFGSLRAEVAEGTQAHDAVGMVSKDVVPGGQQVVCLHQL